MSSKFIRILVCVKLPSFWKLNSIPLYISTMTLGFPGGSGVKNLPAMQETLEMQVWSLGQEDPLEEDMATHSSILAGKISRTEEPGGPQRVGHNWSDRPQHSTMRCSTVRGYSPPLWGLLFLLTQPWSQAPFWAMGFHLILTGSSFNSPPPLEVLYSGTCMCFLFLPKIGETHSFYPTTVGRASDLLLTAWVHWTLVSTPVRAPVTHPTSKKAATCQRGPLPPQSNLRIPLSAPVLGKLWIKRCTFPGCLQQGQPPVFPVTFFPSIASHQILLCDFPDSVWTLELQIHSPEPKHGSSHTYSQREFLPWVMTPVNLVSRLASTSIHWWRSFLPAHHAPS